jgi:hypothetical protein
MAYQGKYEANSFLSVTDLSTSGPIFMKLDSTGRCLPATLGTFAEGVLENTPGSCDPASISYEGITKVTVDALYPINTVLQPNASGVGTVTSDGTYGRAVMLMDSTAANDIVAVRLIDARR